MSATVAPRRWNSFDTKELSGSFVVGKVGNGDPAVKSRPAAREHCRSGGRSHPPWFPFGDKAAMLGTDPRPPGSLKGAARGKTEHAR
ncbi:MAG: hypothetical protein DHS20C21_15420 [Gemmatimonadota bacterium]|nr:MAG: hypothetical protein DHS20C21_15420 [Gemmatimonadota bacterium]